MTVPSSTSVALAAVIVAVTDEVPRVLLVRPEATGLADADALPSGPFDPTEHSSLDRGVRGWVKARTGLDVRYVEQLYTFGNRFRDPDERRGGPRLLTVAYLVLAHEHAVASSGQAIWRDWYGFLPWEDWREGRPVVLDEVICPALRAWIRSATRFGRPGGSEGAHRSLFSLRIRCQTRPGTGLGTLRTPI